MRRMQPILAAALAASLLPVAALGSEVAIDSNSFGGLRARSIGPAAMSGRIAAIDAAPGDPLTIYVGAASGGVWKSTDAGTTWKPIFDEYPQSIGAVRVDPKNPAVVWVGTGESWVRNSVSVGKGVYKSTDAGESWQTVGLASSERIAEIRVDPTNTDTVFVCATGPLWSAGEERGVFRSADGGKSWEKVLYVNADTGCSDLALDPQDPTVLYAGMWQFRRQPDFFTSGGAGSGLYKSSDGGKSWARLEKGLPTGELGRIAIAVAPSRPNRVFALVEAKKTALYRSDDLGGSWEEVNDSANVQARPFYFGELAVDPEDFNRVYRPAFVLTVSNDGGKSFSSMFSGGFTFSVHPDHHALWIDPRNPQNLLLGTDGGLYASHDRGRHWSYLNRLPIAQFYHVSHDMEWPYNVYGGLQDNGSWMGPSRGPAGSVLNQDWRNIGFGDGFWAFPDPSEPSTIFVEYQGGQLMRLNRDLGEFKDVKPYAQAGEGELRFNWNTPLHLSPNHPGTIYYGSQFLHRSTDRGESWRRISPDLTTNDPKKQRQSESGGLTIDNSTAENYTTIYTIAESPKNAEMIWVGTDDGNLQLTRDSGTTWQNLVKNVAGLPAHTWVSSIEAGRFDAAVAFVTFDGHRNGDMATHVFKTTDYGVTWQSLATAELDGYAWVIKQDRVNPELLYLGTEHGLFLSVDGGRHWARFKEGLPPVAVHDIAIHPTEHDVILATHGRGIYILDDVTPIRALTQEVLDTEVALLPSRPAVMMVSSQIQDFSGDDAFKGANPSEAAAITYYLKKRHLIGDFKAEVYDGDGKLITTLPTGKRRGLNRIEWPMRLKPPRIPPATNLVPAFVGPRVPEGTYKVKLIKGKTTTFGEVALVADPRSPHSAEDRKLQQKIALDLYHRLEDLTFLVDDITHLRDEAKERAGKLGGSKGKRLTALSDALEKLRGTIVSISDKGMLSGDEKLRERMGALYGAVSTYDGKPTASQLERLAVLVGELEAKQAELDKLLASELGAVNALVAKAGLAAIERLDRAAWEKQDEGTPAAGVSAKRQAEMLPWLIGALAF